MAKPTAKQALKAIGITNDPNRDKGYCRCSNPWPESDLDGIVFCSSCKQKWDILTSRIGEWIMAHE
jgi:hypothetical protein